MPWLFLCINFKISMSRVSAVAWWVKIWRCLYGGSGPCWVVDWISEPVSGLRIWLPQLRFDFLALCSGLRIWHCHVCHRLQLWLRFSPWPGKFHMLRVQQKTTTTTTTTKNTPKTLLHLVSSCTLLGFGLQSCYIYRSVLEVLTILSYWGFQLRNMVCVFIYLSFILYLSENTL